MARRSKYDKDDEEAIGARKRVAEIIDEIPPEDLVDAIKRAPSLRGIILGYIAELMFERYVPQKYGLIDPDDIEEHDDHDRRFNKSDRTISLHGRLYRVQLRIV